MRQGGRLSPDGVARPSDLVFPAPGGKDAWSSDDWATWRKRVWRPAAKAAGLSEDTRPRDLRGSFASLLIWQGMNPVEVAEQLGHSAVMCLTNYAGVFAEMGTDRKPAEDVINEARSKIVCRVSVPDLDDLAKTLEPSIGLEPMTPSLPWKCSTN
jgi:hypothetical protein